MKSLPAPVLIAVSLLGASASNAQARSFSFESLNCLFQVARPARVESVMAFSFLPLAESLALHSPNFSAGRPAEHEAAQSTETTEAAPFEISTTLPTGRDVLRAKAVDPIDSWPVFDSLRRFRENPNVNGLSHTFSNPNSFIALDYSDIFETGRAAYKGGHGISLFFERAF